MASALEGIKVIDVSQVIAVPVGARHLADFGAEVIHIEHPERGDSWRGYLNDVKDSSAVASRIDYNWETFNRNKKSVAVDISTPQGQEIIHKLVAQADVFTTNLRLWEREKYHLDYGTLKKINPKIIYGSITGFGTKGPEKNLPAYDYTAHWYRSGVTHMITPPGVSTLGFRSGFGDTVAGLGLFSGILLALYHRQQTGIGQEVELSLLHTGIYQLSYDIAGALVTGHDIKDQPLPGMAIDSDIAKRQVELTEKVSAAYEEATDFRNEHFPNVLAVHYFTKDKRIIHLNMLQPDRFWTKVCKEVLKKPELEHDPRFDTHPLRMQNNTALYHIMKDAFAGKTLEEWKLILSAANIPYAPKQNLVEVVNDPQARANNCFPTYDHPVYGKIEIVANPINLSETPATYRLPAPEFSQHTEEVLLELGYSWEDISRLKDEKVIG